MKRIILSCIIIIVFLSCSSDDSQLLQNQEDQENFYGLTVGNSWVYKNYKINQTTGNYDYLGVIDSVSIVGTEEIGENLYYKQRRYTTGNEAGHPLCYENGEYFELLRDSLGFLINASGKVLYSKDNFDERVYSQFISNGNILGTLYEKLQESTNTSNVEAGVFECLDTKRYYITNDGLQTPGLDHYYYSKGVGLVFSTLSFISNPTHSYERRLNSYDIQ